MFGKQHIGIVGNGFVGAATQLLGSRHTSVTVYDADPSRRQPPDCQLADLLHCDIVFICVPTPRRAEDNSCDTSIVESVVAELEAVAAQPLNNVVIRSTVPPGTCRRLGAHSMPEFLTEKNWRSECRNRADWLLGLNPNRDAENMERQLSALLNNAFEDEHKLVNRPRLVCRLPEETEAAKYLRNSFLALKVAFANEAYRFCEAAGIKYDCVRELIALDERIGASHLAVPGHDGSFGFGGSCLPKDLDGLLAEYARVGVASPVLSAAAQRNRELDRAAQ